MENGAFALLEQMHHFPKYFQIYDILKAPKGAISWVQPTAKDRVTA